MRRNVFAVVLLFILGTSENAIAAMRVTSVDGLEVTVERGTSKARKPKTVATQERRISPHANVTINAGPDTDAANNDYRRIQNAINTAVPTDVITLAGTFNFTAPFAAAAWALGNDNTAATGDDYAVTIPLNLADVTLTATALGNATIQGPGDLAAVDLEGFLYFDGAGDNPSWTISNLRILDFDLGIGMFNGAGGVDSYNDTVITNNFIRLPQDLNGTVAPGDPLQNIAIHYSFGTNQSINGNTIHIPGNSLSDVANNAANVGMQSNTSGGAVYDGLSISNNVIHVLNAQAALPEVVLGFWENAHGHTSDINVTGNQFINDSGANNPALNLHRAFRVTSHSGAATLVEYDNNQVGGANIGFQWITGSNFTGNQAVVLFANTVTNSNTGVLVQSNGIANLNQNVITGSGTGGGIHVITGMLAAFGTNVNGVTNSYVSGGSGDGIWIEATAGAIAPLLDNNLGNNTGFGLLNQSAPLIVAERNWWGNNLAANVAAEVSGNADFDPWLASGTDIDPVGLEFDPFLYATTSGTLTSFVGTNSADTGALLAGDPVTMQMNGDTAFTALAQLLNFHIQLEAGDDVFTLGQTGVPTIFDGHFDNDTLVGTNVAQSWNITGANSGNIPGATSSFVNVESVRGGTAADTFTFGAAGSLALMLDGDLGTDTLDNSAIPGNTITPTGPGTLDGFMGTATGIGAGFDNINNLIAGIADLSVTKTASSTAPAGGQIHYTITVTNNGPDASTNTTVTDTLPAGVTFVSATPSQGSCSGTTTVTCNVGTLAVSASATIDLIVNVTASEGAVIVNTATADSDETDPTPASGAATVTVGAAVAGIPTAGEWGLLALAMMLGVVALTKLRM
jgi:uncharacterized repeat protein (TIGR01451 family)